MIAVAEHRPAFTRVKGKARNPQRYFGICQIIHGQYADRVNASQRKVKQPLSFGLLLHIERSWRYDFTSTNKSLTLNADGSDFVGRLHKC